MAAATIKASAITNRDATTQTLNRKAFTGGVVKQSRGTVETVADAELNIYRIAQVPSGGYLSNLRMYSDDIGSGTAAGNIGLYYETSKLAGAAVDADCFTSAYAFNGGAVSGTEMQHESTVFGVEDYEKPFWEIAGLSADPKCMFDVCITVTTAFDAVATLTLLVEYVDFD
jgi:hypothetical protein